MTSFSPFLLALCLPLLVCHARPDEDILNNVGETLIRHRRASTKDVTKKSVTQDERALFLKTHNDHRAAVSPTAANMQFMIWNDTLEGMAQVWALRCKFEHGNPEDYPGRPKQVGQNLWKGNGGFDPEGCTNAWHNEVDYYTYSSVTCQDKKVCGHYTQVVWENSYQVGCGIAYCDGSYIIVCNYHKPGNWKGKAPYVQGTPCSECPAGYTKCVNNLCKPDETCDGITCANGEKMDTTNCLCECDDDTKGPFCGDLPGSAHIISSGGLTFLAVIMTAITMFI